MNIITDTYTATDERYYLVTEEWPDQPFDAKTYWEYMFVPSQKIFRKNTLEESPYHYSYFVIEIIAFKDNLT